jgi:hypothetical protein
MVEAAATGQQRHRLLAGVDQVVVLLVGSRRRAHARDAVLALQDDLVEVGRARLGQVFGPHRGQADAEVDNHAFGDVARHAGGHLVSCPGLDHAGPGRADALGQVALWHQFQLDLAGAVQRVEVVRVGEPDFGSPAHDRAGVETCPMRRGRAAQRLCSG